MEFKEKGMAEHIPGRIPVAGRIVYKCSGERNGRTQVRFISSCHAPDMNALIADWAWLAPIHVVPLNTVTAVEMGRTRHELATLRALTQRTIAIVTPDGNVDCIEYADNYATHRDRIQALSVQLARMVVMP